MSTWDHERWTAMCSGTACPICCRKELLDVIATLETSWVTMQEFAPVPGYVCLVSRTHAVELHELAEQVAVAFMRDAQKVSKALSAATGAVKLNYEIHGNSLPHLHMHFLLVTEVIGLRANPSIQRLSWGRGTHRENSREFVTHSCFPWTSP